jgi:hypothetical protein
VRTVHLEGACMRVEHFWLCGECSRLYDFLLLPGGRAIAIRRENPKQVQQFLKTEGTPEVAGAKHGKESVSWAKSTRQACQCVADKVPSRSREALRRQLCEPLEIRGQLVATRVDQKLVEP